MAGTLFFVATYFAFDPIETAIHRPVAHAFGLHLIQDGAMAPVPYGVLMIVRLALDLLVVVGILAIRQRRLTQCPLFGPAMMKNTPAGFATGFVVMIGAISFILLSGGARVSISQQPAILGLTYANAWLVFGFIGAAGEELAGRVTVLLVTQPLIGRRGAILASGILFAVLHLGNPGVTGVWLVRLFLQGLLLAYAIYRTGSFWWSVGYHTGWNWGGAPLFGAAGSGYLNKGHLLDFVPTGPDWITGGAVGPEGSVFAYIAILIALALLVLMTRGSKTAGKHLIYAMGA